MSWLAFPVLVGVLGVLVGVFFLLECCICHLIGVLGVSFAVFLYRDGVLGALAI